MLVHLLSSLGYKRLLSFDGACPLPALAIQFLFLGRASMVGLCVWIRWSRESVVSARDTARGFDGLFPKF